MTNALAAIAGGSVPPGPLLRCAAVALENDYGLRKGPWGSWYVVPAQGAQHFDSWAALNLRPAARPPAPVS